MKNKILLLFTAAVFLISCSSDDNIFSGSSSDIVGTWDLTLIKSEGNVEITLNGITESSTENSEGKDYNVTYVFSENPNSVKTSGTYTNVITYTTNGNISTSEEVINMDDNTGSQTWSLNTNTLVITDSSGEVVSLDIIEFTDNKLRLKSTIDETENDNGLIIKVNLVIYITLER